MDLKSGKKNKDEKAAQGKENLALFSKLLALNATFEAARAGAAGIDLAIDTEAFRSLLFQDMELHGQASKSDENRW
ncbi:MAG: hypothetical protein JRH13_04830 [Deltaproteobacteria bacterium]|nr:hypothetical protein [Deltaproteobacteria bacterium]MBW2015784.1 hypothetical protein [Deltaproteobacteria bacterium]MBW2128668.1 hypothetical protein [Deltaproteobacteria bacterium]MBW2302647.1 hypothetical protein [Deltaproteobacteria bacterium]